MGLQSILLEDLEPVLDGLLLEGLVGHRWWSVSLRTTGLPGRASLGCVDSCVGPRFIDHVTSHGLTLSSDLFRPDAKFD